MKSKKEKEEIGYDSRITDTYGKISEVLDSDKKNESEANSDTIDDVSKKVEESIQDTAETATKVIKEGIEDTVKIGTKGYKEIKKAVKK